MPAFLISYRIHDSNPTYGKLKEHITGLSKPRASHLFDNTWIIESEHEDARSVKATFEREFTFDSIDQLLVTRISDLPKDPDWAGVNIKEARPLLDHETSTFAEPSSIKDGLEVDKQVVFFVSCDHKGSNTDKIERALKQLRGTHAPITTSSWILVLKKVTGKDDLLSSILDKVSRSGGVDLIGLVIQLTRGFPEAKGPFVHVLHTLAAEEQAALTRILDLHIRAHQ